MSASHHTQCLGLEANTEFGSTPRSKIRSTRVFEGVAAILAAAKFELTSFACSGELMNAFMNRAIQLAISNAQTGRGGPFGSVIVRKQEIVAEGVNGVTQRNDPTAHAEVVAIRNACEKLRTFALNDCELYTSCEPCPMCLGAIYWARISRVYFACTAEDAMRSGFDDSLIYQEIAKPFSKRQIPMQQIMRDEALATFRAWEETPNKSPY